MIAYLPRRNSDGVIAALFFHSPLSACPKASMQKGDDPMSISTTDKLEKVKTALLSMQRHSWEQGVAAHAFLDLGETGTVIALARSAVLRQKEDGRSAVMGSSNAVTDPCAPGEAIAEAWRLTKDPLFKASLDRLLDWALHKAPRTSCGVVCHVLQEKQVWADSCYMLPPFLAAAGHMQEAVEQMEGYHRLLCDSQTGLFRHIWNEDKGCFDRADYWGGGNGWAAAAMARLLHRIPKEEKELRRRLMSMELPLLDALRGVVRPDGLAHDILDRPDSFVEVNFSQMYAYALFTGIADGWLAAKYLPLAQKLRSAANEHVDAYGFVRQVCGAPDFCRPGISPEGQAFCLLMEAAAARCGLP